VVETGQPNRDATSSQMPPASSEASMPTISSSGESANSSASTIPLRIVAVTSPPASTAPANSKIAAMRIA
jgi:hypothetical protein